MAAYQSGLGCLPERSVNAPEPPPADSDALSNSDEVEGESSGSRGKAQTDVNATDEKEEEVVSPAVEQSEREMKMLRAVLNANIAACYLKLVRHASILPRNPANLHREITKMLLNRALKVCFRRSLYFMSIHVSTALLDDPDYVKALERRATCNDTLNTWSSLTSAQEGKHINLSCSNRSPRSRI
jgi:hypothetical protein